MSLHLDFETYSEVGLKKVGAYAYATHPSTEILCMSVRNDEASALWVPGQKAPGAKTFQDRLLWAWNALFEILIWQHVAVPRYGFPEVPLTQWRDTMALAAYFGLPLDLDRASRVVGGEKKDRRGSYLISVLCKPVKPTKARPWTRLTPQNSPELFQEFYAYCEQDTAAEKAVHDFLPRQELPPREQEYWFDGIQSALRGVTVDTRAVKSLIALRDEYTAQESEVLDKLTGGITYTQGERLREHLLIECGVPLENMQKGTLETALQDETLPADARRIIEIRLACNMASVKKLDAMLRVLGPDGKAHGMQAYFGAHCVPGETEVLTPKGWQRIDHWDGGTIAQMDSHGNIDWKPAARYVGPVVSEWLDFVCGYDSFMVTPGHKIPYFSDSKDANLLKAPASNLHKRRRFNSVVAGTMKTPAGRKLTSAQMRFIAMVQADGSVDKRCNAIRLKFQKERKAIRCRALLQENGIEFSDSVHSNGCFNFRIRRANVPAWFDVKMKHFGPFLLNSSVKARKDFLHELSFWDGGVTDRRYYCTSVKSNAEWVQIIAHLTGARATVRKEKNGSYAPMYRVSLVKNGRCRNMSHAGTMPRETVIHPQRAYCTKTQTGMWVARYKGMVFITGNTGRDAGRLIQLQNLPRGSFNVRDEYLDLVASGELSLEDFMMVFGDPIAAISTLIRGCITASPGKFMYVADFTAIEAVVLSWMSGDYELLEAFRRKEKIYEKAAAAVYQIPAYDVDKGQRGLGKVQILGCGYGMGKDRFAETCEEWGVVVDRETSDRAVDLYRQDHPAVVDYWYAVDNACKNAISTPNKMFRAGPVTVASNGRYLFARLPSGRTITYPMPEIRKVKKPWGRVDAITYKGIDSMTKQWRRIETWGGSLVENWDQGIARDVMKEAQMRTGALGFETLFSVHDEIVSEHERDDRYEEYQAAMIEPPAWAPDLPIHADGEVCKRFRKG